MMAIEMSELARDLCLSRLRGQHPDWSDAELQRELMFCVYWTYDLRHIAPHHGAPVARLRTIADDHHER